MTTPTPEPWPSPGPLFASVDWCDACGGPLGQDRIAVQACPCDIATVDSGNPATLCPPCVAELSAMLGRSIA
jgi:hypothetical protein